LSVLESPQRQQVVLSPSILLAVEVAAAVLLGQFWKALRLYQATIQSPQEIMQEVLGL
jgi:hypothetical protein